MGKRGKLRTTNVDGDYVHWCQGCEQHHCINTKRKNMNDAVWAFNGDFDNPTFTPSVNIGNGFCHYTITNGMIHFHDAKNHNLGGQTLPLIECE